MDPIKRLNIMELLSKKAFPKNSKEAAINAYKMALEDVRDLNKEGKEDG